MTDESTRTQRAVVYLRVASARRPDANAIIRQREGCQHIAQKYGLTVVREYIDDGQPARLEQQHELRRLLCDLDRLRDAEFVIVWDYARLSRDMAQLEAVTRLIRSAGAEVATLTGVEAAERFVCMQDRTRGEP